VESKQPRQDPSAEKERRRRLTRSSGRVCPRCGQPTLVRHRRPAPLRWLKVFGLDVRAYRCALCGHETVIHQSGDAAVRVRAERAGAAQDSAKRAAPKRRRLLWPAVTAAALLVLAGLAAFQLLAARHHLISGVQELRAARDTLSLPSTWRQPAARGRTRSTLAQAQHEFSAARSDLRLWTPIIDHLAWVPVIGGQLAAASPATDTAIDTTRSALHLLDGLTPLWPALTGSHSGRRSLGLVAAALQAGHRQFLAAESDADQAAAALRRLPRHSGNATLDHAGAELRTRLPALRSAGRWLAVAPEMLGVGRPRHDLVLLQNPANIAPTGGMIGAVDYLTLSHGAVHGEFGSVHPPHEITSVSAPLPEELYSPIGYWTLIDSNWSPDFPLAARTARWFYGEDTGRWSDAVIGLLDTGIVRLLGATGPVYLPAFRRWVDASNVESLAQLYVNGLYHGPSQAGSADTVRKQFLGDVMQALINRLQSEPVERLPAVGSALTGAIAAREIQIYDRRGDVEKVIRASGADGSVSSRPGDFLAVVDFNESDNKLNPYVHESAQYRVRVGPDLWLDSTLSIHYDLAPSPPGLEGSGPALGTVGTKHDYEDYLRVYVPRGSRLVRMSGAEPWAALPAYGLTQLGGRFIVREGHSRTVTIHYRVPANAFDRLGFDRYSLTVRHQAGANLASLHVAIQGRAGVTLGPRRSASVDRVLRLDRDAGLQLSLGGPLRPRVVSLPRPSGPIDPYMPFADLRDPRHPF
jgi:hypothetical protein